MPLKILIVGDYHQEWRAPAWARGLREAGAEIIEHNWSKDHSPGFLGYMERRFLLGPGVHRINRRLSQKVSEVSPHVILIYAGRPILPKTIRKLAQSYCVAGYDNDDPFGRWGTKSYYRYYRQSLPYYTCHHVFRDLNVDEYRKHGCEHVKVLLPFYLPWIHYPIQMSDGDKEKLATDVVFIGNGQPDSRIEGVVALVEEGITLRIYGNLRYWHRYLPRSVLRRLPLIVPATGLGYSKVICSAKICLAFFSDGNRDHYSVRSFEIPACGGFMLAHRTPAMKNLFEEGQEAEYFGDSKELITKVRHYLEDGESRRRIAAAGRERCLRDGHDVVNRMRQWLLDLREWGLIRTT